MLAVAASIPAAAAAQAPAQVVPLPLSTGGTAAQADAPVATGGVTTDQPAPAASTPATGSDRIVHVLSRDLVTSGSTSVSVRVRALDFPVSLELRVGRTGRKVADGTVAPGEKVTLTGTANRGETLRLLVRRTDGGPHTNDIQIGTVKRETLRPTTASWYGPGLYGQRTACGQTLTRGLRGVANKSLKCGTKITVRYRGRSTSAVVVDRGPYVGNREFDLTYATAQAIGFNAVGRIYVSR
jgi:hypothetical protein